MRILLDECLPAELADELPGHEVRTAQQQGWSSLENGELLRRAAGRLAVFITVDKHIERTQKLPETLSVITIRARTNRIESLRPLVPKILEARGCIRRPSCGSVHNYGVQLSAARTVVASTTPTLRRPQLTPGVRLQ